LGSFASYSLANYQNQLIIAGFNSTNASSIQRTVYICSYSNGKLNIFNNFTINSTKNTSNSIFFGVSPQLTKIHTQYYNANSSFVVEFKQIDFVKQTVKTVDFKSQVQYLNTTNNGALTFNSDYALGDNYLVIRNSNVEEAYQFLSGSLIYLRTRTLAAS
jgi:hypothetical protein